MERTFALLVLTASMLSPCTAIKTYELSDHCDNEISMILRSFYQGRFTLKPSLPLYKSKCDVDIESWYFFDKMMFYFETFNLTCHEGQIEFFDGSIANNKHVQGLDSPLCGNNKPEGIFVTDKMDLNIRYTENTRLLNTGNKMTIIVTAFGDFCQSYYYECDNGRCITDDINCSGYNSCGDHSDCETRVGVWGWVGIGVGCLVGLAVLITALVGGICCYMSSNRRNKMQQQQAHFSATHGTTTFSQQQPFVAGQQTPYPTQGHMTYSSPQTGYGVQQAEFSQSAIPK